MTMKAESEYDFRSKPTKELYDSFQLAYEFFNWRLFENKLPNCLITLQRRQNTYGYFAGQRFRREDGMKSDEIALNPSHFNEGEAIEVLSTLGHEMVHLYQHHFGKPGRGRYHNREWARIMMSVGLQPSSTGEAGGKETGDKMNHFIIKSGSFESAANELFEKGFSLNWSEIVESAVVGNLSGGSAGDNEQKSGKRIKYKCGQCGLNVWAKHDAKIDCHEDKMLLQPE